MPRLRSAELTGSGIRCPACGASLTVAHPTLKQPSPPASGGQRKSSNSGTTTSSSQGSFISGTVPVMTTIEILFFTHSLVYLPVTLTITVGWTLLISRFGLVATVMHGIIFGWVTTALFTLNLSAWYASSMLLTVFLILLLLGYGFKVSLANRQLFGDRLANE